MKNLYEGIYFFVTVVRGNPHFFLGAAVKLTFSHFLDFFTFLQHARTSITLLLGVKNQVIKLKVANHSTQKEQKKQQEKILLLQHRSSSYNHNKNATTTCATTTTKRRGGRDSS